MWKIIFRVCGGLITLISLASTAENLAKRNGLITKFYDILPEWAQKKWMLIFGLHIPPDGKKVAELIIENKSDPSEAQKIFYEFIGKPGIFNEVWATHALSYVVLDDRIAYEKLRRTTKGTEYEIHANTRFDTEFAAWLIDIK